MIRTLALLLLAAAVHAADKPACVADSSASSCSSYIYPDELSQQDLQDHCTMMPEMTGCTIWNLCKAGKAKGTYCKPFTILATICEDMPGMSPCNNYNALCKATSTVKQCKEHIAIPRMLMTVATRNTVLTACADHTMPSCSQCKSGPNQCPDPLSTMANLCHEHPSMQQCASFFSFCAATNNEIPLCSDGLATYLPSMKMYFHQRVGEIILWRSWIPRSTGAYVGSIIAVLFFGILSQLLKVTRLLLEARWQRSLKPRPLRCGSPRPPMDNPKDTKNVDGSPPSSSGSSNQSSLVRTWWHVRHRCSMTSGQLRRSSIRSAFQGVTALLDYFNMLVVMTFNIGLCIAVVVGYMTGTLLFSHLLEERPPSEQETDPFQFGATTITASAQQADDEPQCCCSAANLEMGCGC